MTDRILQLCGQFLLLLSLTACVQHQVSSAGDEQSVSEHIRINQLGYLDNFTKRVSVVNTQAAIFQLLDAENNIVFTGNLVDSGVWEHSGEHLKVGDFSAVKGESNSYRIQVKDKGVSHPFEINSTIYSQLLITASKSFYLQRASIDIKEQYAGQWKRALGHPDDNVGYHPSTGLTGSTASPKGWYDAGDFGKYVVNGAVSASQLLSVYELYPSQLGDGSLNIPESGNGVNDLLDEVKYQLDWLLSMQDGDGGLFHKLTSKTFEGMIAPNKAKKQRLMMAKSTAATLDFAALTAQAARVYLHFYPEFSRQLLIASERAWQWSLRNNHLPFKNPDDVITGQYDDNDFNDEFFWASAELYTTTGETIYLDAALEKMPKLQMNIGESWRTYLGNMGMYSMLHHAKKLPEEVTDHISRQLIDLADHTVEKMNLNAYSTAIDVFEWGSNSDILNALSSVAHAYYLTADRKYLDAVVTGIDYIFGRNATGYSFVTGYGDKQPMHIHHRQSSADGIAEPVPGFVVGGPNAQQQDKGDVNYQSSQPAKSYQDVEASYASNEVAINWNSPLVFLLVFINANL